MRGKALLAAMIAAFVAVTGFTSTVSADDPYDYYWGYDSYYYHDYLYYHDHSEHPWVYHHEYLAPDPYLQHYTYSGYGHSGHGVHSYHKAWGTLVIASWSCHYGKVTVTMHWSGNNPYAVSQYVDMSYTDNGWKPYTFTSAGPFYPSVNSMSWDGLAPSTRHFLRFNQQFADGSWDPSLTFVFDTPACSPEGVPVFLQHTPDYFGTATGAETP